MPPNSAARTHYDVLGVTSSADHAEIRKAYHQAARRWHPDRFASAPAGEAATGEVEMRRVNEAWETLGDPSRRRDYDRSLDGPTVRAGGPGASGRGADGRIKVDDDGVIRIDPRLLDPDFVAARRHAQIDEISTRSSMVIRYAPAIVFLGLIAAIFIFTAYARESVETTTTTTFPGPNLGNGIQAGDCVSIIGGPALLGRPCDANAVGMVVGARLADGQCPAVTLTEVELSNGVTACLGAVP